MKEDALMTVWVHSGQAAERKTIRAQIERFKRRHPDLELSLTFIPERSYNAQLQAAALAGDLPDVLEFDGPYLYSYVWQGHLQPLDSLLSEAVVHDLLPSIQVQGAYAGHLYGVGVFDSGLGLYARRSALLRAGVRIPEGPGDAWSIEEFEAILKILAKQDKDGAVLDIKRNYPSEWFTYAFSPIVQSAGGDLIDRKDFQSTSGTLNGPASVQALTHLQHWIQQGWVDPNVDDAALVAGRVDLSWVGHWEYNRYHEAIGDDLVVLPLPDFGQGSRTGQGSWQWGVTQQSAHPDTAARFLEFLLSKEEVLAMTDANGAVPGVKSALEHSVLYAERGPLRIFARQLLEGFAVPRPQTAAYPVITSRFARAVQDIVNGVNVQQALDIAAGAIDRDIRDNDSYRMP